MERFSTVMHDPIELKNLYETWGKQVQRQT